MIPDLKPVEIPLRVSRALLRWVIIVHGLSAAIILFLSFFFGLNLLVTTAILLVVCLGCFYCYRKYQSLTWCQIMFDSDSWTLFSAEKEGGLEPLLVELIYHYRFGKSWVLGFRQLDKKQKRIVIPLLPDSCDQKNLRQLSHLLLMANV